ncbi:CAP domain-containing protein [Hwanghaeella sp. LZ110]|uniref:CAP domain-containing protein n=1 Tax=Hwanghaeella sp. LZ110 TaxID=3402810 RepID=UPI003B67B1A4
MTGQRIIRGIARGTCAVILMTLLIAPLQISTTGPAGAQADEKEPRLIEVINRARAERNRAPLRYEPRLTQIARQMAQAIYQGQKLDALTDGLETLLKSKGYPYTLYGGRYAINSDSVEKMVTEWLEDGGQQSILTNKTATEIGVAYLSSEGSLVPDIEPSIWTVVIAAPARPADSDWAQQILQLVNQFRATYQLPPLQPNAFLNRAGMAQARDMLARDFFSHTNPDNVGPGERATKAGYKWSLVLENIAAGQSTPRDVVNAWIASKEGHREAMLNPDVTELGIGYVFAPFDPGRIKSLHYWAMTLGKPRDP